ncbi:MAG: hypothetical protein CMO80_19715 [Verrucomicrobiales bacterium]|nr:hypothetical protein [Verrucomicrobiales bacterium]|tara:strand:- start:623 stop:1192 length:570 start_codon:yes stop_codon:yes gene_type:complete
MSLPVASHLVEISPGIVQWSAYSEYHKVHLTSHTVIRDGVGLIFDPIPLVESAWSGFVRSQPIEWQIVVTNVNHERDSQGWHERLGCSIRLNGGNTLPQWQVFPLQGGAEWENCFFHSESRLAVIGDALVNLTDRQLEILPEKYSEDRRRLREELRILVELDVETVLLAHGNPVTPGASEKIRGLLEKG